MTSGTKEDVKMEEERNPGMPLDHEWLTRTFVNGGCLDMRVADLQSSRKVAGKNQIAWHLRAVQCIDLTTLAGDDMESNVSRLCMKAVTPLATDLQQALGIPDSAIENREVTTAAVCVYPNQVKCAADLLTRLGMKDKINVASVAAGFPSGQYPLSTRLAEIRYAVDSGASEIDIVINRGFVLGHQWQKLYDEIKQMREACGSAHLKTILSVGELGTYNNIYNASLVAMMAGSDFIKTSTGKEDVNATLPIGLCMCRAVRDYYVRTGVKVGFKPAGGIKTSTDALNWLILIKEELGDDWLTPKLFRFGASGLLGDLERQLFYHATGRYANINFFSMA